MSFYPNFFKKNTSVNIKTGEPIILTPADQAMIKKYGEENFWAIRNGEKTEERVIAEMEANADYESVEDAINDNINRAFDMWSPDADIEVGTYIEITSEERAELDKMNAESEALVQQYANLSDQEIASITNEINSQKAAISAEIEDLNNKYQNGEIPNSEYNAKLNELTNRESEILKREENHQVAITASKTYKEENTVIESMTDSQKSDLEKVNNKMLKLQEQLYIITQRRAEVMNKAIELNDAYQNGEITKDQYNAEFDKIEAQDNELQSAIESLYKELEPLEAQREAIFEVAKITQKPVSSSIYDVIQTEPISINEINNGDSVNQIPDTAPVDDIETTFENNQANIANENDIARNSEYYSIKDEIAQLEDEISKLYDFMPRSTSSNSSKSPLAKVAVDIEKQINEKKAKIEEKKEKLAELRKEKDLKNQALSDELDKQIESLDIVEDSNSSNNIDADSKQKISNYLKAKVDTYEAKVKEEKIRIAELEKRIETFVKID